MSEIIKSLKQSPKKRTRLIFAAGIIGIALIFLSEFIPQKSENGSDVKTDSEITFDECEAYKESIEDQLSDIISNIQGVGEVKVMVTISGTKEYVYAEQSDVNRQTESGAESVQKKNEIILADGKSENQPVVKKIIAPEIGGAVVVCEGASNAQTKERVLNAVSAALGLPSNKISVEPSK